MRNYRFLVAAILLSALLLAAQSASAEEIVVSEHNINLHILSDKNAFEKISYATGSNKSFSGTVKAWIPEGAINVSINEISGEQDLIPLNFQRQGNIASFNLTIPPLNSTSISINYDMIPGFFDGQFEFKIETLYPVESLRVVIISQTNFNITTTDNIDFMMPPRYVQAQNYYLTVLASQRALNGQEKISIKFAEVKTQTATATPGETPSKPLDISPYVFTALLLIVALVAIMAFFLRGKKKGPGDDAGIKAESEAILATLKEIENDYKAGKLDENEYKKLKGEYEARKAGVERKLKKR